MWRKTVAVLIGLLFITQIVLAQGSVVYLPLIFKGDCMANWAKLEISDGTTTVSLIAKNTGFHLTEWNPQIIQPKEGGVFQDSPLAAGRRLVFAVDATAIETFELDVNDNDQNGLITQAQDLMRLLLKARAYQSTEFQDEPVWVRARSACETNDRYALVINWVIPQLDNPYAPPFFSATELATMEDISLQIERGHWLALTPGESECVEISNQQTWDYGLTITQVASNPPNRVVGGFARHAGSGALYAVSRESRIMKSSDSGATWANNLTGAPLSSDVLYGILALANNNLLAYGDEVSGTPLIRSTNDGGAWSDVSAATMDIVKDMIQVPTTGTVIAVGKTTGSISGSIWRSTDNGGSFTQVLPSALSGGDFTAVGVAFNGDILAAGYLGQVYRSVNDGVTWTATPTIINDSVFIDAIVQASDGNLYASAMDNVNFSVNGYIWKSTDNGSSWNLIYFSPYFGFASLTEGVTDGEFFAVTIEDIAGTVTSRLMRSTDYGASWNIMAILNTASVTTPYRQGVFVNPGDGRVFAGTGDTTANGYIFRSGVSSTVTLGHPVATCENEVYVSNKANMANLTHIYRDDGGVFTSIFPMTLPVALFPATPAANDALYFGIQTSAVDSGPFSSLVFDIGTRLSGDCLLVWEYWSGASWVTLTVQDNTNSFSSSGVNSAHWSQPSDWAATAVNGITGYWVRLRVSSTSGTVTVPTQQNRSIYSLTQSQVELQVGQVRGDIPAVVQLRAQNRSDFDGPGGSGPNLYANRIIMGLRAVNRGDLFTAFINLAQEQNNPNIQIWPAQTGTVVTFDDDPLSPTGRRLTHGLPSAPEAMTTRAILAISTNIIRDFYGTFHCFVRGRRTTGTASELTLRLQFASGSGGIAFTTPTRQFNTTNTFEILDFGEVSIPVSGTFRQVDVSDVFEIRLQTAGTSTTPRLHLYDLILIPTDEWSLDAVDFANSSLSDVGRSNGIVKLLDVDSITDFRTDIKSLVRQIGTEFITAEYNPITPGPAVLQANTRQRLWFFAMQTSAAESSYSWIAPPEIAHSVQVYKNERYLGLRGER